MVSDYRAFRPQGSTHIPQSPSDCFFIEQVHSVSSARPEELGRDLLQPFHGYHHQQIPHPYPYPYPNPNPNPNLNPYSNPNPYPYPYHHPSPYVHDMHAAIQREIEKEKIREEIIMSEIMRRRELEAEVRRELMMERELVLHRGTHGLSYGAPSVTEIDLPKRLLEERIVPSLMDRRESGGLEPLPFQRGSADVRNSEVIPVAEVVKEKERIILGAKPNENTCGTKREASKVDATESSSGNKARKKAKEEWSCALCKVSSNSQHALNEHLKGKKHKTKEAALKGAKKFSIGLLSKKPAILVDPPVTVNKVKVWLDKTKKHTNKLNKKEKCEFWCELCQVAAPSQKVLNSHRKGKKHVRRLMSNNNCGAEKLAENGGAVDVIKLDDGSTKANVVGEF